jgi:2-methylcitrate dehydratase PrpD
VRVVDRTPSEQAIGAMERSTTSISETIANFAADLSFGDLPAEVIERSKLFVLDCVGIAFASTRFPFAEVALNALRSVGGDGPSPVVGIRPGLHRRDAALMNGILMHGLDYDDTHMASVCHASASALPTALAIAVHDGLSGADLLLGYILAVEVSARIGAAANGGFHEIGFHPTSVAGAFGCATAAAKMQGLPARLIAYAQGFAGSTAAGPLEFLDDGSWTKRAHPGLAASNALTAAAFASQGFQAPRKIYEGKFGLFATHLQTKVPDLEVCRAGLGETWEVLNNAVKPFPVCHFAHAFADAALILVREHGIAPEDIARIDAFIHPIPGQAVSYPAERKQVPQSEYEAKFSLPYIVAACIIRGRFGLAELEQDAREDRRILDLAQKVTSFDDPESGFPKQYSGALSITLHNGQVFSHREQVNRGAEGRPLTSGEIVAKFRDNMSTATSSEITQRVEGLVLSLDTVSDSRELGEALRG